MTSIIHNMLLVTLTQFSVLGWAELSWAMQFALSGSCSLYQPGNWHWIWSSGGTHRGIINLTQMPNLTTLHPLHLPHFHPHFNVVPNLRYSPWSQFCSKYVYRVWETQMDKAGERIDGWLEHLQYQSSVKKQSNLIFKSVESKSVQFVQKCGCMFPDDYTQICTCKRNLFSLHSI